MGTGRFNDTPEILTFGKYKGQPVDVLQSDPDYCEWLINQKWLPERFPHICTLIINNFLSEFANRPDTAFSRNSNRPILCILDEFPRLTFPYDTIDSFLSTLRSKSVVIMPVCQSVAQLVKKYGDDGAQSLLGNCTYQVCCKANDEITRNHFVNTIGMKKTLKESFGSMETEEPVYPPSKYGNLTDTAIVYLDGQHSELTKIKSYQ